MRDLFLIGFILILVGIVLITLSLLSNSEGKTKFAFFGFIGPIPFGFSNSKELLKIAIITSIVVFVIFLLSLKFFRIL